MDTISTGLAALLSRLDTILVLASVSGLLKSYSRLAIRLARRTRLVLV